MPDKNRVGLGLFEARKLLIPQYLAMTVILAAYVFGSVRVGLTDAWGMLQGPKPGISNLLFMDEAAIKALESLDAMMVANVLWLLIKGSYMVYVNPNFPRKAASQRPQALHHMSPDSLKYKMASSLIGVSSVKLMAILMNQTTPEGRIGIFPFIVVISVHITLIIGFVAFKWASIQSDKEEHYEESHGGTHDPHLSTDGLLVAQEGNDAQALPHGSG